MLYAQKHKNENGVKVDKTRNQLTVEVQKNGFVDEGKGIVSFPDGLTITDGSVQRNGTKYDIDSLDISKYSGELTGDHEDKLSNLIGEVIGTTKRDGKIVVNKIRYAIKENPYAQLAYDLLVGGFSKNFSTETLGAVDQNSGIYWNSELVGLSQVVTQNNYNAHINEFNQVVHNSLEKSKEAGLNIEGIEEKVLNHVEDEHKMDEKQKEEIVEEVVEKNKLDDKKETETKVENTSKETETQKEEAPVVEEAKNKTEVPETAHLEVANKEENKTEETQKVEPETVENEVDDTTEQTVEEKETNNKEEKMEDKKKEENSLTLSKDDLQAIIANALAPVTKELETIRADAKNAFDASAKEPEFKKEEVVKNDYKSMDWQDRYQQQIDAAWNAVKMGNVESWNKLREINQINLDALKEAKIARNSITLDDLGNFVIAPEMYNEIVGHRNDYTALLNATEWKETLSLEFAWLKRVGDIDMQNVAIGVTFPGEEAIDGNDDARLKPISEYSAVPVKSPLEELAAVTVVATSATRFAAVDLLADAAAGYRTDYDRKRAQLVIAKLEEAVDETGKSTAYNPGSDTAALTTWLTAITDISDTTLNGTLIFNARTYAELKKRALSAGISGPLAEILITGDVPTIFGYRFIVVPNDLMPSLGGSENVSHEVQGVAKTINHAVFYADLSTFTGRTSGGLQYDVSNSAPYESGGTVKSAYQRNELVLRGSFFRGGAVKDVLLVAGVRQGNSANVS